MKEYQLAQINIARIRGRTIEDPIMKEFVDNLDHINKLAESSEGFVWRLKDGDNNALELSPYEDEKIIINISVWETFESLENFVYRSGHLEFVRRRMEWFQKFGKAHYALWWLPDGKFPTIEEAVDRLNYLQENGVSIKAFNFRKKYPKPHMV